MFTRTSVMVKSLGYDYGGAAAEVQQSFVQTTDKAPSDGKLQSSEGSVSFIPADIENSFDNYENYGGHGVVVFAQDCTCRSVFQEPDLYKPVVDSTEAMSFQEIKENASAAEQEEDLVKCSEKCAIEIQEIDGTEPREPSLLGNGKFSNVDNGIKRNRKKQELEEKKEKPRRRGGKARKNNDVLKCCSNERRERKGLQYSREEMVALRFENLEEQKKKWIEVYCGLATTVAEYDGLAELNRIRQEDSFPRFDFDPRLQFLKSSNLGEEYPQFEDNHLKSMSTSDPSCFLPISDETGSLVVEEESCEDDESDEDYSSIQRPAFLVMGEPDFDSGPPQDGLEYLKRVRWEAARIPNVKVAKVNKIKEQTPYMPHIPDVMKCPENLLPLKQWEDSFLTDFSELRQAFARHDLQLSSEKGSIALQSVHGDDIFGQMLESNAFQKLDSLRSIDGSSHSKASGMLENSYAKYNPDSPGSLGSTVDHCTFSVIMKMDPAARTSMLKRRISSVQNMSRIPHNESLWLFALCTVVDYPLNADTGAALRSLLRKCASLRASKTEVDDEVIILNILVTISGRYFGQLDG